MNRIQPGQPLPKIVLPDQKKQTVDLSALKGKKLLLSFHPLAWTDVCMRQMEALEMNADLFEAANAVAFGISVDPVPSKKAWAESMHVEKTRLLSDFWPHGAAAQALGLFREEDGFSERAAVLVDQEGIVRFVKVYPLGEVPNVDELLEKLKEL
jgi:peroxiredoxin